MGDLISVLAIGTCFLIAFQYVHVCERLRRRPDRV
jgi:hypothetical protein